MGKDVTVGVPTATGSGKANPATVSIWQPFSHIHIYSAYNLALKAAKIEDSFSGSEMAPQNVMDQHFAFVIGSIFASVAFLETIINEVFLLADARMGGKQLDNTEKLLPLPVVKSMAQIWNAQLKKKRGCVHEWEKKKRCIIKTHWGLLSYLGRSDVLPYVEGQWAILDKFQLALYLAGQDNFDKQRPLWTDVNLLIRLRNLLVHYKPKEVTFPPSGGSYKEEADETTDLMAELEAQKKRSNPLIPGQGVFIHLLGASCAMWAVDTSLQFVSEFAKRMPLELNQRVRDLVVTRQKPSA